MNIWNRKSPFFDRSGNEDQKPDEKVHWHMIPELTSGIVNNVWKCKRQFLVTQGMKTKCDVKDRVVICSLCIGLSLQCLRVITYPQFQKRWSYPCSTMEWCTNMTPLISLVAYTSGCYVWWGFLPVFYFWHLLSANISIMLVKTYLNSVVLFSWCLWKSLIIFVWETNSDFQILTVTWMPFL